VTEVVHVWLQEFSSSRARIVSGADDDMAAVRLRMQRALEAEDVRHAARLHAAVAAALQGMIPETFGTDGKGREGAVEGGMSEGT